MTSHDVRDMLDLPNEASRPAKKLKVSAPRPVLKGLAREVQNLSGDNPITIVPEISVFRKKKRFTSRKPAAKWELKPFSNSARADTKLILKHWRRTEDVPPVTNGHIGEQEDKKDEPPVLDDSTFAKYNVQVQVPSYEPDQYKEKLEHPDWTREETGYLLDLVREFDLRWPVIWDRYEYMPQIEGETSETSIVPIPKVRSMEDLKARYYSIAAKMMAVNTPLERMKEAEFHLHELMLQYNPAVETNRKTYCEKILTRTKEEAREEESLLLELKRILARSETLGEERRELYARLEAPPSHGNIGLYTSSQGLQSLLQQLMTADKSKKRKTIMGAEGVSPASGPSGSSQQPSFDRRDSNIRESISVPAVANNKKGAPAPGVNERRQLSKEEEITYGVSHHERLTASGPAYRQERLSKPITSKSAVQQGKIINVLNELEVPSRLIMPTQEVGEQWEGLLSSIHILLEARKVSEKLSGEILVQKNLKAEKEKKEKKEKEAADSADAGGAAKGDVVAAAPAAPEREPSAAPSLRSASAAQHKRSASVLSTTSDKSAKRQKK